MELIFLALFSFAWARWWCLFWQKNSLNVWQNAPLRDGNTRQQLVQFFIISNGQLKVTRNDSWLFVVPCSVSSQFKHFCCQIFQDSSKVHRSTTTNSICIIAFAKKSMDTTNWKLKTGFRWSRFWLVLYLASLSST